MMMFISPSNLTEQTFEIDKPSDLEPDIGAIGIGELVRVEKCLMMRKGSQGDGNVSEIARGMSVADPD